MVGSSNVIMEIFCCTCMYISNHKLLITALMYLSYNNISLYCHQKGMIRYGFGFGFSCLNIT